MSGTHGAISSLGRILLHRRIIVLAGNSRADESIATETSFTDKEEVETLQLEIQCIVMAILTTICSECQTGADAVASLSKSHV
jgi:hypothetical protein